MEEILSAGAMVCSVLLFASPIFEIRKIEAASSPLGQSFVPFVCTVMVMQLVNAVGLLLTLYFLFVWIKLPRSSFPEKQRFKSYLQVGLLIIVYFSIISLADINLLLSSSFGMTNPIPSFFLRLAFYFSFGLSASPAAVTQLVGISATLFCIVMFASPLVQLKLVVHHKNAAFLNIPLSFVTLLNCSAWIGLGMIVDDLYMIGPNSLGFLLASVQIVMFFKYPPKPIIQLTDPFVQSKC